MDRTSPSGAQFFGSPAGHPISRAVRAGDFVFTSAFGDRVRTAADGPPAGGVEAFAREARATFDAVEAALALAGTSLADVVDCQVWLRDAVDFDAMNDIFRERFGRTQPVRSVFQNSFMFGFRIEVKVIAYAPAGGARPSAPGATE